MQKMFKRVLICGLIAAAFWTAVLVSDRNKLNQGLIRFHVVANSDSHEDQTVKQTVRDAVLGSIQEDLRRIGDIQNAREYLQNNLPKIHQIVKDTLRKSGFPETSSVSLCREVFDIRHYDTFSLPAGVYESLRIVIGEGEGQNWWCVSFPALCMPATIDGFADAAVGAGFSAPLVQTLAGIENYEIHFYLLNQLGKLQNILFRE